MTPRRILLFIGSAWELARLFLVLSLLVLLFEVSGGRGSAIVPWLLLASTGNLLVPAGAVLVALYPVRYAPLIGLLRLGKLLNLFTLVLIVLSGLHSRSAPASLMPLGRPGLPGFVVILLVTALDAVFLALLVSLRSGPPGDAAAAGSPPAVIEELPPADVEDFH
jgi:hypothetical protein